MRQEWAPRREEPAYQEGMQCGEERKQMEVGKFGHDGPHLRFQHLGDEGYHHRCEASLVD